MASFNLLPWDSALAAEPGRLLIGNRPCWTAFDRPKPQTSSLSQVRAEADTEARAEAAAEARVDATNASASLAKPPISVFKAPQSSGSMFGNRSTVLSAANAPPGGQRQASKVSVMQALPTELSIEERVLEMQVEYVLESGEGVQADEASLTKPGGT